MIRKVTGEVLGNKGARSCVGHSQVMRPRVRSAAQRDLRETSVTNESWTCTPAPAPLEPPPRDPRKVSPHPGRRRATPEAAEQSGAEWGGQLLLADFVRANVCAAQSEKAAKVHDPNL